MVKLWRLKLTSLYFLINNWSGWFFPSNVISKTNTFSFFLRQLLVWLFLNSLCPNFLEAIACSCFLDMFPNFHFFLVVRYLLYDFVIRHENVSEYTFETLQLMPYIPSYLWLHVYICSIIQCNKRQSSQLILDLKGGSDVNLPMLFDLVLKLEARW